MKRLMGLLIIVLVIVVPSMGHGSVNTVSAQSGWVWLPVWQAFALTNTAGTDLDLMPYIQNVCSGNVGGLMFYYQGKMLLNGTEHTNNDGWRMLNSIDASSTTANNMRTQFFNWYMTNGDGFGFLSGMSNYSYGALTGIFLRDGYTDEANRPPKGSQLYELYVYCQASSVDFSFRDRFTVVDVPQLAGSLGTGFYNQHVVSACEGVSETSKPIGVLAHAGPQGQFANLFTAGTYWNVEFLDTWQSGHVPAYRDFMYSKMNDYIGQTISVFRQNAATGGWIAHNIGVISNPINFHAGYAFCFDTDPDFGLAEDCTNVLYDGNMEQQPISSFWFPETTIDNRYTFGRLDSSILGAGAVFGSAICGEGQQVIGNIDCFPNLSWLQCQFFLDRYADIRQRFYWPGGKLYYEYSAKGRAQDDWNRNIHIMVYVKNMQTFESTLLRDDNVPNGEWVTRTGGTASSLASGNYTFYVVMGTGNVEYDSFIIDDVIASQCPLDGLPCTVVQQVTATPATVTPTGTRTPVYGENIIENCGFSQGEAYWKWQLNKSFVIYGPNNYAHAQADAPLPAISQSFFWPGGLAYVRYRSDTNHNVYIRHRVTNAVYPVSSGLKSLVGWLTYQVVVDLPAGSYDIVLHYPANAGPGQYDDITIASGTFVECNAGTNLTPTAPPSATPNNTPTMWPTATQPPTSTVLAGTATSTPRPTNTPWPTFTVVPTLGATYTPKPYATYTPYPTYTPRPTYTALPTYTPNAEGTIEPSLTPTSTQPPQPPPDYYSECERPDNGDVAGWIEYNRCVALSFFTWSPRAGATLVAMPTLVAGKEPFGTVNEAKEAGEDVKGLVDSYDWQSTGMEGTTDDPDIGAFMPGADNPWFTGRITFTQGAGTPISTTCTAAITSLLGPYLAAGYCWLVNFLREKGITPWLQLLFDLAALGFLAGYLIRKWIDAGANSN